MKISTKKGDKGKTTLLFGVEVEKDDIIINCLGDLDELSSSIGLFISETNQNKLKDILLIIQKNLFVVGAGVAYTTNKATDAPKLNNSDISFLENKIDEFEALLPELKNFILPGGSKDSSFLFFIRAIARRAERVYIRLSKANPNKTSQEIAEINRIYLNRLSDLLFLMARFVNLENNIEEIKWTKDS